ncbi:adenine-specific DNA-methyltransferase [Clostridium beijerinckii]|uniref:Eco57I restriction-modification methylase domain-containing protein n=1 Tax=Clostridium beijerinckii TaxID=1520 RepID=UPI0014941D11|nr:Eco57I restriction-modification methylase domain-containing protein [Clostridium beijerinckii]NOW92374.1 adenine-specific DNA-methyltransferase [Clostridium beijerinckii]
MNEIIKKIEESQSKYLSSKKREYFKKNSQFFTPYDTAYKMISTIDFCNFENLTEIHILEPSAGCGILIAALLINIFEKLPNINTFYIDLYETDEDVVKILKKNLSLLKKNISNLNIKIKFRVINKNFIIGNKNRWAKNNSDKYDIIISNPPYKKINQSSPEAVIMNELVYGQPNIYTLFIAMSLKLLKNNGIYTVLSPRNYLTGEYSTLLRKFIFNNYSLTNIHSFKRGVLFPTVNQEVIISTYSKSKRDTVNISFNGFDRFQVKFKDIILNGDSLSICIPKTLDDMKILKAHSCLECHLNDLGFNLNVGPIVQFRNKEYLSQDMYSDSTAPLLIAPDIQGNNTIIYKKRENLRKTHNKSVLLDNRHLVKNHNYLLLRKVSTKNDQTLIVCAVNHKDYFQSEYLGFDNNLLYFYRLDNTSLSLEECYGLYCFINSSQFLSFYSIINGTHTINVTDFAKIRFPNYNTLTFLGKSILESANYTRENCTMLIKKYLKL